MNVSGFGEWVMSNKENDLFSVDHQICVKTVLLFEIDHLHIDHLHIVN